MPSEDQTNITDAEGLVLLLAFAFIYLAIRLPSCFRIGFRNLVPPAEVKKRMDAGEALLLLDVRRRGEFKSVANTLFTRVNANAAITSRPGLPAPPKKEFSHLRTSLGQRFAHRLRQTV